jgi:hypothetical protein
VSGRKNDLYDAGGLLYQEKQSCKKKEYHFLLKEVEKNTGKSEQYIRHLEYAYDVRQSLQNGGITELPESLDYYISLKGLPPKDRIMLLNSIAAKYGTHLCKTSIIRSEVRNFKKSSRTISNMVDEFDAAYEMIYEQVQALKAENWDDSTKNYVVKKIRNIYNLATIN